MLVFILKLLFIKFPIYLIKLFIPKPPKNLSNEIILITGAASGIGRLMALDFAKEKPRLIVCWDLNEVNNEETVDLIWEKHRVKAVSYKCNLADRGELYEVALRTQKDVKKVLSDENAKITMLINNAGIVTGKALLDSTDDQNELTMTVNSNAHFRTIKTFLPDMLKMNHGHIVCIASVCGLSGAAGCADYCASKHAVVGLMESLYLEIKKQNKNNVKCTIICPWVISTGMFQGFKNKSEVLFPTCKPEDVSKRIIRAVKYDEYLVVIPGSMYLIYYLKPFIVSLMGFDVFYEMGNVLGTNYSMDTFKGRK